MAAFRSFLMVSCMVFFPSFAMTEEEDSPSTTPPTIPSTTMAPPSPAFEVADSELRLKKKLLQQISFSLLPRYGEKDHQAQLNHAFALLMAENEGDDTPWCINITPQEMDTLVTRTEMSFQYLTTSTNPKEVEDYLKAFSPGSFEILASLQTFAQNKAMPPLIKWGLFMKFLGTKEFQGIDSKKKEWLELVGLLRQAAHGNQDLQKALLDVCQIPSTLKASCLLRPLAPKISKMATHMLDIIISSDIHGQPTRELFSQDDILYFKGLAEEGDFYDKPPLGPRIHPRTPKQTIIKMIFENFFTPHIPFDLRKDIRSHMIKKYAPDMGFYTTRPYPEIPPLDFPSYALGNKIRALHHVARDPLLYGYNRIKAAKEIPPFLNDDNAERKRRDLLVELATSPKLDDHNRLEALRALPKHSPQRRSTALEMVKDRGLSVKTRQTALHELTPSQFPEKYLIPALFAIAADSTLKIKDRERTETISDNFPRDMEYKNKRDEAFLMIASDKSVTPPYRLDALDYVQNAHHPLRITILLELAERTDWTIIDQRLSLITRLPTGSPERSQTIQRISETPGLHPSCFPVLAGFFSTPEEREGAALYFIHRYALKGNNVEHIKDYLPTTDPFNVRKEYLVLWKEKHPKAFGDIPTFFKLTE